MRGMIVTKKAVSVAVLIGLVTGPAVAVNIETVPVGDPGNAADTRYGTPGRGSVGSTYNIGRYEVTAGQYTEFLNKVAATDTYGLYNLDMANSWAWGCGISRSGTSGSYTYSVGADYANRPVNYVSWGDAARFANWLSNGQPGGVQNTSTTEDGSYDLDGAMGRVALTAVTRKANATWVTPSEDEWYKAAYYKGGSTNAGYFGYPTSSDTVPGRDMADASGNNANYYTDTGPYPIDPPYYTTVVGEFQNSASPYGTFDQGGNVWEWNDTVIMGARGLKGGSFGRNESNMRAALLSVSDADSEYYNIGFRVAEVPEPTTMAILALGGIGMLVRRRGAGRTALCPSTARRMNAMIVSKTVVSVAVLIGLVAGPAFAVVNIETVPVGDPENTADTPQHSGNPAGQGSVSYRYNIGKYEVTQGQYTEFLNKVAATDTYELYNTEMADPYSRSAISRSGAPGNYTYSVDPAFVNRPVNYVTYWNACRFTNWLSNGQPTGAQDAGTTERGAYTLDGYNGHDGRTIQRNPGATWAVPSEDEWYKAAYYKGGSTNAGYWDYPTRRNTRPGRDLADASGNNANYGIYGKNPIAPPFYTTVVGEFQNSVSPYGTFDQGGNVQEWNEAIVYRQYEGEVYVYRVQRGGSYAVTCGADDDATWVLRASFRGGNTPDYAWGAHIGFRVVEFPDCNHNGIADSQDIAGDTSEDCNLNGVPDECEPDCDANGVPDGCDPDTDSDGVIDACDNCPQTLNQDQANHDNDSMGDACDDDDDDDGAPDVADNCPLNANPQQENDDGDGAGNVCDDCPDTALGATVDQRGCPVPIPGDFDHDGDVDQTDFGHLQACMSGSAVPQPDPGCANAWLDEDSDVDATDLAVLVGCLSGPGVAADPNCAE